MDVPVGYMFEKNVYVLVLILKNLMLEFFGEIENENPIETVEGTRDRAESFVNIFEIHETENTFT